MDGGYAQNESKSQFDASFREFCEQPGNREMIIACQEKEIREMQRSSAELSALQYRSQVLRSGREAQQDVAPFLENKVLRRIVKTFTNDQKNDFSKWITNPLVIQMLTKAKEAFEDGKISEEEAERVMVESLSHSAAVSAMSSDHLIQKSRLHSPDLVTALNEHIHLRVQGNQLYGDKKFEEARSIYEQALMIVNSVDGMTMNDQNEIEKHRALCLMNIGAVCMALKDFGEAVHRLNDAEKLLPNDTKLLLRRAKAHAGRSEFDSALADLQRIQAINGAFDVENEIARIKIARLNALRSEKSLARKAMSRS